MPIAHLAELDLYYEIHGDGPPVVMLHGATQTFTTTWKHHITPFAADYRLIGVDMRGHGQSTNPAARLDLRQMADDIAALLGHLTIDRIHLIGYSGGASVALFFAHRHLERLHTLTMISNNMERDTVRSARDFWNPARVKRDEPKWYAQVERIHTQPADSILQWWRTEDVIRPNWHPHEISHIDVPTLVMGGDRDAIIPLEQTLQLYHTLPNAQLAIIPGVGHGIPLRRPQAFTAIAKPFLNSV